MVISLDHGMLSCNDAMSKVNNVFKTLFGEFLGAMLLNFEHVCVFFLDQQITTFQSVQTGRMDAVNLQEVQVERLYIFVPM